MLKRFFYASASVLMLALAYHLGANSAAAQAPGNPVVAAFGQSLAVVTANGDVYASDSNTYPGPWHRVANVFGSPTPAAQATWGQVKAGYRK
jgi:hypothetical protein